MCDAGAGVGCYDGGGAVRSGGPQPHGPGPTWRNPPPLERARARRPQYPQHAYAVAQLETLSPAATAGMRYTPTFSIYRGGRKVDEVVGKEPQRLEDHLWLHSD